MISLLKSFKCALKGLVHCFLKERSFRIQCVIAAYVFAFAPAFLTSAAEWAVIIITVFLTLSTEALNTSLENLSDLFSVKKNDSARVVKDVAAGAVLLCAICSTIVGFLLFWKTEVWYNIFEHWKKHSLFHCFLLSHYFFRLS